MLFFKKTLFMFSDGVIKREFNRYFTKGGSSNFLLKVVNWG